MRLLLAQVKRRQRAILVAPLWVHLFVWRRCVGMTDLAAMTAELLRLEGERRRVESRLARLITRVESSEAFRADGHGSVAAWLAAECDWSPGEIRTRIRLARLGRHSPEVLDALDHGQLERHKLASSVDCGPTLGPGTTSPTRSGCSSNRRPSSASRTSEWCVVGGRPWLTRMAPIAITHVPTTRGGCPPASWVAGSTSRRPATTWPAPSWARSWNGSSKPSSMRNGISCVSVSAIRVSGAARAHPGPAPLRRVADHLHHGRYRSGCASSG